MFFLIPVTRKRHYLARTSHRVSKRCCHTHVPGRFDRLLLLQGGQVMDALMGALRRHPPAEEPWGRGKPPTSLKGPGGGEAAHLAAGTSPFLPPGPRPAPANGCVRPPPQAAAAAGRHTVVSAVTRGTRCWVTPP